MTSKQSVNITNTKDFEKTRQRKIGIRKIAPTKISL